MYLPQELEALVVLSSVLRATLLKYSGRPRPHELDQWAASLAGFFQVEMQLAACLLRNPDWTEELDRLIEPVGCPAQKVQRKKDFLRQKGVTISEGMPIDFG